MKTKIVAVGDIGIDYYINKNLNKPGGIAFNFALHSKSSETKVSLVSPIGKDTNGNKLRNLLKKCSIDTTHIKYLQGKTAKQRIILGDNGERKFDGYNPGVLKDWELNRSDLKFISKHDAIFVPLSDGMEPIFDAIKDLKTIALKAVDFSQDYEFADFDKEDNIIVKYCQYFDINFIGGSEKQIKLIKTLSKKYPKKVFVLTLGSKGSMGFAEGKIFPQPAEKINNIVDTTGAGDAFQASFLIAYFKSHNIKLSLQKATDCASKAIQHIGSVPFTLKL